jgi:inorganic pyrophosphatase
LDISDSIATTGEIRVVKVLGVIALLDEGETDWKVIGIDVRDPNASKVNGSDLGVLVSWRCLFNG